jgi:4,5-dihydroxyphthalate decarboxylase
MTDTATKSLWTLLGDYPVTAALKRGALASSHVSLRFADVPSPHTAFKRVVRDLEFDVAELALVTYIMAKAYGKPLVLLPVVLFSRCQHPYLVYNAERGVITPRDLAGRRVGARAYSVTTVTWIRGLLADDHGVDIDRIRWVTLEDPHVAEYHDPPEAERAAAGKDLTAMLLAGEIDAAILGAVPDDPRLQPVIPQPAEAGREWQRRNGALQLNHMVVVRESLTREDPLAVREVYRLLSEAKRAAGPDETTPLGVEANRRSLDLAVEYAYRQRLIPRRLAVDELFDDVTRSLGP